jgi:hypothetical protein
MKSLSVKLGVILIGLIIFSYAEVWGEDWKLYFVHEYGLFYYDTQSITHPSKKIIRVLGREDLTEKGVIDVVEDLGKIFENSSHIINLWEINCLERTCRLLSLTYYDKKGGVIYSKSKLTSERDLIEWDYIIPGTMADSLYKEVCK